MSLKDEVKIALIKKGWSQRELARQMKITATYLQDILVFKRRPVERLRQMENLLDVDLSKYIRESEVRENATDPSASKP
ncbi:helix-turn-helix transcriptional regulator [Enterococcus asini]|uniref:Helix-turn-helix transcriptional regulator n=1 Tax=Enterococcus asini TaxID=57732 RepID=A0AAW8TXM0_9ENTE|nr:helix-turn-helix transcriptional regulator [Enterococcus asini]MDT2809157.1 helix-turn-helix transcriptional regulator [Enterococcus asini]